MNGILTYRCRDVLFSPKKLGLQDADFNRNLGLSLLWQGIPALQRAAAVSTSCPQSISRGRDALELRFGAELRLTCHQGKKRISRYLEGICKNEVARQNWAVWRKQNLERNSQTTYIASAGSTSAKRSWGPCWKFDIALGCLKLQETELYVSVSLGLKNKPFTTQSYLYILQPLNMRLEWETWLETMTVAQTHHVGCKHHLETTHSLDSTAACFKQDQSITINHVSSVLPRLNFGASHWF